MLPLGCISAAIFAAKSGTLKDEDALGFLFFLAAFRTCKKFFRICRFIFHSYSIFIIFPSSPNIFPVRIAKSKSSTNA